MKLRPVEFHQILSSDCREVQNESANQRPSGKLSYQINMKKINLVVDIEHLPLVKFRLIPWAVGNNNLCFPIGPKNKWWRGRWVLKISSNSVQYFQRSRRILSEVRQLSLFSNHPNNTNMIEDIEFLREGKVDWSFNVTINNISVIHVTAHRCAGGLKKK